MTEQPLPFDEIAAVDEPSAPEEAPPALPSAPFSFLTGPAGTGKTFLVKEAAAEDASIALCASTGIASINLGAGETINAFGCYFDTASLQHAYTLGHLTATLGKHWRTGVRTIVLDEVSMFSGDQLTIWVRALEELAVRGYVQQGKKGGWAVGDEDDADEQARGLPPAIRLVLTGDFCQLPPVKAPYAFESPEWEKFAPHVVKLTEIRRQTDREFVEALQATRRGDGATAVQFFADHLQPTSDDHFEGPTLFAKNESVDRFNRLRLDQLTGAAVAFQSSRWGKQRGEWGNPEKHPSTWGIPETLQLKVGALVMILANRRQEFGRRLLYANGDLATLIEAEGQRAWVKLHRTGEEVCVDTITRRVTQPADAPRRKELREQELEARIDGKKEILGEITYMPLRVAYASTVHKCVAPHTRVQTLSNGVTTFRDLRVGDVLPTGVVTAVARSEQSAYRITTQLGYTVDCSADHRWMTEAGLRRTTELLPGVDRIQLALGRPSGGVDFAEEDAYWLGLLVGDGNYTDRDDGTLHFASISDHDLGDAFARGALRLGARQCTWRKDRRGLHTTCRALREKLQGWGLEYVKAPDKVIPSIIWSAHSGAWAAFLRGLYDADGSVARSGVVFCTASPQLAQDVQELLLLLGIVARRQVYPGRKDPYYQVYVGARGLSAFKVLIGFGGIRKRRRLVETLPNRSLTTFEGFDTIESVTPLQLWIPMIDVEITAPHLVGFGPFVGHNSQGLSLDRVQINLGDSFFGSFGMCYVALSRARTAAGLRLVGSARMFVERCVADPRLAAWL